MKRIKSYLLQRMSLAVSLVLFVFGVMLASLILIAGPAFWLMRSGLMNFEDMKFHGYRALFPFLFLMVLSILIGTALTIMLSKKALRPIRRLIAATHRVSEGDFGVQVQVSGIGEMQELAVSFNKMVQELANTETLRSDFVNNFSHEFKTPIVSVRGFAKLLKDESLTKEERDEYIDIIIAESERLSGLATSVLELSRVEKQEIITERAVYPLDEQIRQVVLLLQPKWEAKSLHMDIELLPLAYYGNEDLLRQAWINLVDNAVKFTPEGGEIHITLRENAGEAVFRVADTGCGMDEATMENMYDKFYQGDVSHAVKGNGLGLAMVQRIVQLCGGRITAQSHPGEGAVFTVTLPLTAPPAGGE